MLHNTSLEDVSCVRAALMVRDSSIGSSAIPFR